MDHRYTGYPKFRYYINVDSKTYLHESTHIPIFLNIRDWCTQTWGVSCERNFYLDIFRWKSHASYNPDQMTWLAGTDLSKNWCWSTDDYKRRIYLRSDEELALMLLRWN